MLARTASCGANLLVNVGPMSDGSLTPETMDILNTVSGWVSGNREAVYGTTSSPFRTTFDWGHIARRGNDLFLYMKDAVPRTVEINGLNSPIAKVVEIRNGEEISFSQEDGSVGIRSVILHLPAAETFLPVYRVRCSEDVSVDEHLLQQGDILNLHPLWARKCVGNSGEQSATLFVENNIFDRMNGKRGLALDRVAITSEWVSPDQSLQWDACFIHPGRYRVQLVTLPGKHIGEGRCGASVQVDDPLGGLQTAEVSSLEEASRYRVSSTGVDNVRVVLPCGEITVRTPGTYRISLFRTGTGTDPLPLVFLQFRAGGE